MTGHVRSPYAEEVERMQQQRARELREAYSRHPQLTIRVEFTNRNGARLCQYVEDLAELPSYLDQLVRNGATITRMATGAEARR